jgi:glyoxylase-like metal-dependent hydrolase (beta-lactamase superfamily II)
MPSVRLDVISIGTLSRNRLWNESQAVRTPHSTTTLIRTGKRHILIDPGLPPAAIGARLFERAGLRPEQIDTVFLTNFRPAHRGGLALFSDAKVFLHSNEIDAVSQHLRGMIEQARGEDIDVGLLKNELRLLESIKPAPDKLAEQVDLFPLPGYTPGTAGLLVAAPTYTAMIAGDAVPRWTISWPDRSCPMRTTSKPPAKRCARCTKSPTRSSPGHDNLFMNPRSAGDVNHPDASFSRVGFLLTFPTFGGRTSV